MGNINFLFRGTFEQAEAFLADDDAEFPAGVDLPDLIIRTAGWAEALDLQQDDAMELEQPVGEPAEEGPWVLHLAPELTSALAGLDETGIRRAAAAIASTEEATFSGYSLELALVAVEQTASLAREASVHDQHLFVLVSV